MKLIVQILRKKYKHWQRQMVHEENRIHEARARRIYIQKHRIMEG